MNPTTDPVSALQDAATKLTNIDTQEQATDASVQEALSTVNDVITSLQNNPTPAPTNTVDPVWQAVQDALTANGWTAPSTPAPSPAPSPTPDPTPAPSPTPSA